MKSLGYLSSFLSGVMVLKLSKKVHLVLASARNLSLSKQFTYAYTSERSRYALSENGIFYYAMPYCFGDIRV